MFRKLRSFIALPGRIKLLTGEAVFFLFTARLLLLIFPVKTVLGFSLKKRVMLNEELSSFREAIGQALFNADRLSFWKNRCLVKCFAGMWMLQRRGLESLISFGVKYDDRGSLTAHAWLKSGDFEVVGKDGDYIELANY